MTPAERKLTAAAPKVRRALLAWYDQHRRALPWRTEVSPYRTVVSELMLQQTQVVTMLPYFERWVQRWPDFASLARADAGEVLAAWAGLGYYRRARLLHALAKEIAALPTLPRTAEAWLGFTGIGPYTAAAIGSIAFGDKAAVVDGNVVRVLTRLAGLKAPFASAALAVKSVTPLASALLDPRRPGDHNQAVMELGAQVCRKAAPDCGRCPLSTLCASRGPRAANIPRITRAKGRRAVVDRVLAVRGGKVLLRRHSADATRLAGLAELPTAESIGLKLKADAQPHAIRRRSVTVTTYEERIHLLPAKARLPKSRDLVWVPLRELPFAAVSGPHLRWIGELAPKA
ncbi:MAG: A/G-specific adenine glycosylase [Opitutales bacterium]